MCTADCCTQCKVGLHVSRMLRAALFPAVLRRNDELLAQSSRLDGQLEIAMHAATTYEQKLNAGEWAQLSALTPLQSFSRD